eukprot:464888-Amphidinium_carterae.2
MHTGVQTQWWAFLVLSQGGACAGRNGHWMFRHGYSRGIDVERGLSPDDMDSFYKWLGSRDFVQNVVKEKKEEDSDDDATGIVKVEKLDVAAMHDRAQYCCRCEQHELPRFTEHDAVAKPAGRRCSSKHKYRAA